MLFFALIATVVPPADETLLNSDEYSSWIGVESSLGEDGFHDGSYGEGSGSSSGGANDGSHETTLWTYLMITGGGVLLLLLVGWCCYWWWKRTVRNASTLSRPIIGNAS